MKLSKQYFTLYLIINFSLLHCFNYDLIILGAGASGIRAAEAAYKLGKKVALIEKNDKLGGGRLWHGDIPFKTLYAFSNKIQGAKDLETEGLISIDRIHVGQGQVLSRVSKVINTVYELFYQKNFENKNIDIIHGSPKFLDNHTVTVNRKSLSAEKFLIATGARSLIPDIEGINDIPYLIRESFFDLAVVPQFPKSIIIIGGGPLAIELAKVLNQVHVNVTLLIKHAVLLPTYDYEVVEHLTNELIKQGISIVCDVQAKRVEKLPDGIKIEVQNRVGKISTFQAEHVFLACGSQPNVEDLDLEKAGVEVNEQGTLSPSYKETFKNSVITNNFLQTSTPNIYACGDVTGINALTRVAFYQAGLAIKNMYSVPEVVQKKNYLYVPQVLFAYPQEFATSGLTEQNALLQYGKDILIYTYSYELLERAHIDQTTEGMAKFICDKNGIVLGVHIFGAYAGKLIDLVHIGNDFTEFTQEQRISIATSPSYRELFFEVAHLCKLDVDAHKKENDAKEPGWLQVLFTPSLWKKKDNYRGISE